jgi:hypothetical protein
MTRNTKYLRALIAAFVLFGSAALAADGKPDQRLLDALEAEDLKHTVQENGEISVTIEWSNDGGRTQLVRMQSDTFSWSNNEYRDIYSIAFKTADGGDVERKLASRLLRENNDSKLGFWGMQEDTVFSIARLPAKATPSQLREAIFFVAEKADDLEKEILTTDDY